MSAGPVPGPAAARAGSGWSVAPVFLLRQAGFPVDLVTGRDAPDLRDGLDRLDRAEERVAVAAGRLRAALPAATVFPDVGRIGPRLGQGHLLPESLCDRAEARLDPDGRRALHDYQAAAAGYRDELDRFARAHDGRLDDQRGRVLALFRDDVRLRDVLLVSNDTRYEMFRRWWDEFVPGRWTHRTRRHADMLARYLQRVTTKNETNSHFGPVSVGRFDPAAPAGVSWTDGAPLRRFAYFSHWAAEEIGRTLAGWPQVRRHVRPRRHPWAAPDGAQVRRYASTTLTGMPADWDFVEYPPYRLTDGQRWLFERADGWATLAELHRRWATERGGTAPELDETVDRLCADGLLVAHFEVPVGAAEPLRALREQLPADDPGTAGARVALDGLQRLVDAFAVADHDARARIFTELRGAYTELTGAAASRNSGRHYADRGLLHEEALSPVDRVRADATLRNFVTGDLAVLYDLLLVGPRHRMRREREVLADWFVGRFGAGAEVSLGTFYRGYFTDRADIVRRCAVVDDELAAIDRELMALLTAGASRDDREVEVDRAALVEFLGRYPRVPGAVCNPDLMLAATSREALAAGDFLAVVGDCHAMRELLTHTCYSPLVEAEQPATVAGIMAGYRGILEPDEVLCDVVRTHHDKTDVQVLLPTPDVEFHGRSPKDRDRVVPAAALRVAHRAGGLQLRASGWPGRLRLLAPPATGPSIARDPLAGFAFPRHFGGVTIRGDHPHLPRLRCGRVVLQRELWRIDCAALAAGGDAAGFRAAHQLRRRYGLPRLVFAKPPGEPKPVFVDFESPLLVRQLCRLVRGRTGTTLFTEMLPGPDQLWLTVDGRRYTSEVRCAVFG
ncbi:lantibiotic dehydratase [Micromonospora sp. CPCC 206060]|uniref:lantibiotic dehydratase n=1 Tax=Micromonospora sp. CPCC 206060 TaxID=3122406 RepID=UPI002FF2C22F